jgi:cell division protein FtsQ
MQAAAALNLPREASEASQDVRWMNVATVALMVVGLCLLGMAGLQRISQATSFDLTRVQLEGDLQRNNIATVRAHIIPRLQAGYFMLELDNAREAFEAVPWVRRAVVRRVWPDELRVHIEEHRPAAHWQHQERDDQLVNTFGEVFEANPGDVEDDHLPVLVAPANPAPGQSAQMLQVLRELQKTLAPLGDIERLKLTERGSWSVVLDTGAVIMLGRGTVDEVTDRARRFMRTLPEVQRHYTDPLTYADLRYPQAYAVRLRGTTTLMEDPRQTSVARKPTVGVTRSLTPNNTR